IAGVPTEADFTLSPVIVHTLPPIASVGLTETEATDQNYSIKTSQFPLASNGYASILGKKDGFVKVIAEEGSDLILGIHMIGAGAIELSSTMAISMEMVARAEDFTFPNYAHPSSNEALLEAVEGLTGLAIHMAPQRSNS
ncbi:dihydrolipoamide dehydrogenase, partial [Sporosarcina sp. GW1-11]|nr:dihydrolipoamide dehydrogenase [Sporosarcina sp. GW1-11]